VVLLKILIARGWNNNGLPFLASGVRSHKGSFLGEIQCCRGARDLQQAVEHKCKFLCGLTRVVVSTWVYERMIIY
jgi:hypothetical protein